MPFKKQHTNGTERKNWTIRLNLPAFGPTGDLSARTTSKRKAERYEDLLRWLDDNEHWDILEALKPLGRGKSGKVTLPQVYKARRQNTLLELKRNLTDPPLGAAVAEAKASIEYRNHEYGLQHLLRIAPESARLSYVTKPANLNRLVATMRSEDYADSWIRNSLWNGISQLLQFHYGKSRASEIMSEANTPKSSERRDIHLSPAQLHNLVSNCEWEVRMFVVIVAGLGIDLAPALRLRVEDVDFKRWTAYIDDRKTEARRRTMQLPAAVVYALKVLADGKEPREKLFTLRGDQIAYRWRLARKACKLTKEQGYRANIRIKDLRHTFSVHYMKSGGTIAGLMNRLGHSRGTQSLDYARYELTEMNDMESAAEKMGLVLPPRLKKQLAKPKAVKQEQHVIPAWWYEKNAGPGGPQRYQERGSAGWADSDPEVRRETNREYMRKLRDRNKTGS